MVKCSGLAKLMDEIKTVCPNLNITRNEDISELPIPLGIKLLVLPEAKLIIYHIYLQAKGLLLYYSTACVVQNP